MVGVMALRIFHRHGAECPRRPKHVASHGADSVNLKCRETCKVYVDGKPLKNLRSLETTDPEIAAARRQRLNQLLCDGLHIDEAFRQARSEWNGGASGTASELITVAEAKERFFASLKARVTSSTYRTHDQLWRLYVLPFLASEGIELLDEFTPKAVMKLLKSWNWSGHSKNVNFKRAERLRQFFAEATREE